MIELPPELKKIIDANKRQACSLPGEQVCFDEKALLEIIKKAVSLGYSAGKIAAIRK